MVSMQQTNDCVVCGDGTTESRTFTVSVAGVLSFPISSVTKFIQPPKFTMNPNPKWNYFVIVFQSLSHFRISLSLSAAPSSEHKFTQYVSNRRTKLRTTSV